MCKAIEITGWFINNEIELSDTRRGNLRLNKLLYFAQMISLVKRGKPLFEEDIYAFENGVVVESVRYEYNRDYKGFINKSISAEKKFESDEEEVLRLTKELFKEVTPEELSDLTHEHKCWFDYLKKSEKNASNGYKYSKDHSIIPINEILNNYQDDLNLVNNMVMAFENNYINEELIEVNDKKFFYNPNEIVIDETVMTILRDFPGSDSAYSMYIDEIQGLVIY